MDSSKKRTTSRKVTTRKSPTKRTPSKRTVASKKTTMRSPSPRSPTSSSPRDLQNIENTLQSYIQERSELFEDVTNYNAILQTPGISAQEYEDVSNVLDAKRAELSGLDNRIDEMMALQESMITKGSRMSPRRMSPTMSPRRMSPTMSPRRMSPSMSRRMSPTMSPRRMSSSMSPRRMSPRSMSSLRMRESMSPRRTPSPSRLIREQNLEFEQALAADRAKAYESAGIMGAVGGTISSAISNVVSPVSAVVSPVMKSVMPMSRAEEKAVMSAMPLSRAEEKAVMSLPRSPVPTRRSSSPRSASCLGRPDSPSCSVTRPGSPMRPGTLMMKVRFPPQMKQPVTTIRFPASYTVGRLNQTLSAKFGSSYPLFAYETPAMKAMEEKLVSEVFGMEPRLISFGI